VAWLESPNGLGAIEVSDYAARFVYWTLVVCVVVIAFPRAISNAQQGSVAEGAAAFWLNHFDNRVALFIINVDFPV